MHSSVLKVLDSVYAIVGLIKLTSKRVGLCGNFVSVRHTPSNFIVVVGERNAGG
jgi:hypothetical protein